MRIDTQTLLRNVNLLTLIMPDVPLKRVASTHGGEYAGPCPGCGGKDRFRVWPTPPDGPGRYWCRRCGLKGDAIAYVQWREGLSFVQACERLGAMPRAAARPASPAASSPGAPDPEPPPQAWQESARLIIDAAHTRLCFEQSESATRARLYLREKRGIFTNVWNCARLGFLPGSGYVTLYGLNVPAGILIPWIDREGTVWAVNVRRPSNRPGEKYRRIAGGSMGGLYQAWTVEPGRPVLVAEGEFDAMLAYDLVGDLVGVVTLGSASIVLPARWLPLLAGAPLILAAHDTDAAGQEAAARLGALSARVRRLALPGGKDITDFVMSGGDLRALVQEALR